MRRDPVFGLEVDGKSDIKNVIAQGARRKKMGWALFQRESRPNVEAKKVKKRVVEVCG